MKKASTWFLIGGLLSVTILEMRYYSGLRDRYQQNPSSSPTLLFVSALRGTRRQVALPDGSTVWLNAASTLSYPKDMASGNRSVELVGEAFFDVAPKISSPFTVRARDMLIEVLGTRFNIRSYPEEKSCRAFVAAGAVKVNYNEQAATLHAGEEVDVDPGQLNGRALTLKTGMDTASAANWTRGLLEFTDADLTSLLRDLSRAYNVDIRLEGDVPGHRFQGTLSLKEPLDDAVQRLVVPYVHVTITRVSKQRMTISVEH